MDGCAPEAIHHLVNRGLNHLGCSRISIIASVFFSSRGWFSTDSPVIVNKKKPGARTHERRAMMFFITGAD